MSIKTGTLWDKFIEACWLAALVLSPLYMNIYTRRVFEADKALIIRSLALIMLGFFVAKIISDKKQSGHNSSNTSSYTLLLIPFVIFAFAYLISFVFSITPYDSFWGTYHRQQGLYTNVSIWIIFLITLVNLKTKAQIDRIITATIHSSVLVIGYSFLQMLRMDPVFWQNFPRSIEFNSTFGSVNSLAAYLVIIIPLTLSRFVRSLTYRMYSKLSRRRISFYGILFILQLIVLFLTENLGAIISTLLGIFVFLYIYAIINNKKGLRKTVIASLVLVFIFLVSFNLPHIIPFKKQSNSVWHNIFGKMTKTPFISRLGQIGDVSSGSDARIDLISWATALKMSVNNRFIIGYGPESISTISQRYYHSELATTDNAKIYSGFTNNAYIDILLTNGILALLAYLCILAVIIYVGIKALRLDINLTDKSDYPLKASATVNFSINLVLIALLISIFCFVIKSVVSSFTVMDLVYFWIIIAVIYSTYHIKKQAQQDNQFKESLIQTEIEKSKEILEPPNIVSQLFGKISWRDYFIIGYVILTIIISIVLFDYYWHDVRAFTPAISAQKNLILITFCAWLLFGLILTAITRPILLFWIYTAQLIFLAIVIGSKYQPKYVSDAEIFAIIAWPALLVGLIIGALTIKYRHTFNAQFNYRKLIFIIPVFLIILIIINYTNLFPVKADTFCKTFVRYNQDASDYLGFGNKEMSYQVRLDAIVYYQQALKYAPNEKAYLNDCGSNFLELSKLSIYDENLNKRPDLVTKAPTIKELINANPDRFNDFSPRDFLMFSLSCIQRTYELNPASIQRMLALSKIYHYWGGYLEKNISLLEFGLELCRKAENLSPNNPEIKKQINFFQELISSMQK